MIWARILLGKSNIRRRISCENIADYKKLTIIWIFSISHSISLNQSLSWPFREVVATALYDFKPHEPNQLPLRQGCQVFVIGKEGDSKGWWRGKTMDRV